MWLTTEAMQVKLTVVLGPCSKGKKRQADEPRATAPKIKLSTSHVKVLHRPRHRRIAPICLIQGIHRAYTVINRS